jgi:hypothetical protein
LWAHHGQSYDCSEQPDIPEYECEALVDFYEATDGDNWTSHNLWLNSYEPCTWFRVGCSYGHVIELDLYTNNLSGTIPIAELRDLPYLSRLHLGQNDFYGYIPSNFQYMDNIYFLDLAGNNFGATQIPSALGGMESLEELWLYDIGVIYTVPSEIANPTNLTKLDLHGNASLTGELPQSLTNRSLDFFHYYNTDLCNPNNQTFTNWLATIWDLNGTGVTCQ